MNPKQKSWTFPIMLALASLFAASALFGALYIWDNKYTQTAPQADNGVLVLTQNDLTQYPLRYLVRGWELYPNMLLTPQDFDNNRTDGQETYIGQYGGMEAGDLSRSPHGSSTYRLTLQLPVKESEYALDLPEIFSAYQLYINGTLLSESGNTNPAFYESSIKNSIISFRASGQTELIISVTDYSGIYSGMVYPPAFGYLPTVLAARDARLLFHTVILTIALGGIIAALYFRKRSKNSIGLLSCLLCLCFAIATCYPLLHTFFKTAYQPWYTLEILSFYFMLLLMVILQNRLYDIPRKISFFFTLPCIAGVAVAAVYSIGAAGWNAATLNAFSNFIMFVKLYTAGYLISTSVYAIAKQKKHSVFLFCASISFAVALLFDRCFPLYEPIVGGWFSEIGGLILVIAFECALWSELADAYRFRLAFESEHKQIQSQLAMQKEHYHQLSEQVEKARIASHDLRHHMRTLSELSRHGSFTQIMQYLENYEPHIAEQEVTTFTDHSTADAVLLYYSSRAKQANAIYDVSMNLSCDLNFPDDELCILLSNLLENAIEAVSRQKSGKRLIYLRGEQAENKLRLVIENSFDGIIPKKEGRFISLKHSGYGMGIRSIALLVERHGGLVSFEAEKNTFCVSIMIPIVKSDK
ncbi:MAG: GHKL domain-containing protein [Christensenellaceae bacterium]